MSSSSSRNIKPRGAQSFQLSYRTNCSSNYANMEAEIFFKVCSYLDLREICKLGRVCVRWYRLTRSDYVWHRTDISKLDLNIEKTQKLISSLPICVEQLRVGFLPGSDRQSLRLPTLFYELRERCPHLQVLVIENALLSKSIYSYRTMSGYVLNCKVPEQEQVIKYFCELKCVVDVGDPDFYALYYHLRDLSTLSLRKVVFAVEDIFPSESSHVPPSNINVLDLTCSLSATDKAISSLCRLPNLEELYLSGTAVTINGVLTIMAALPGLRILDLDGTVIGGETFSVLKHQGKLLTQLYVGETAMKDADLIDLGDNSFPNLKKLCLRRTRITEVGIKKLLDSLRSLTCIVITETAVSSEWIADQAKSVRQKLQLNDNADHCEECNHFLENKWFYPKLSKTVEPSNTEILKSTTA